MVEFFAASGGACTDDDDCGPGSCQGGYCQTQTRLDAGSTGVQHGGDVNDRSTLHVALDCAGNFPCGVCDIDGIDGGTGASCRCAADNRKVCDRALKNDYNDCGNYSDRACNCYLGPPLPLSAGNTPVCVVNRLARDISGTVDVDLGRAEVELSLRSRVFLGASVIQPCAYCSGDPTAGDGLRQGLCVGGDNDGQSCDGGADNSSFPAPGGGFHSLDCMPTAGKNVSGEGLRIDLTHTTGSSELGHGLNCGFPFIGHTCACRTCSYDTSIPCSSTADCSAAYAGSCTSLGTGINTGRNSCSGSQCEAIDSGGVLAQCATGPDDKFCNGILRADGEGFLACTSATDCSAATIGIDAGDCTLSRRRPCFLATIVAGGQADPYFPLFGAAFCVPPTTNAGINGVAGLPGPVRTLTQAELELRCANSPNTVYLPARGGCAGSLVSTTTIPVTPVSTTMTTPVSTTMTTTVSTTTTPATTVPATTATVPAGSYELTFQLDDPVTVGALSFTIGYSDAAGGFDGEGDAVECAVADALLPPAIVAFNDLESSSTLTVGILNTSGLEGPGELVTCSFTSANESVLQITVTDASTPAGVALSPAPTVSMVELSAGLCGDVTGDSSISVTDALMILKTAVGISVDLSCASTSALCGDVNDDGSVSVTDALLVLKAAVGISVTLICS